MSSNSKAAKGTKWCDKCTRATSPSISEPDRCSVCGMFFELVKPSADVMGITFKVGKGISSITVDGRTLADTENVSIYVPIMELDDEFIENLKKVVGDDLIDVAITKLQRLSVLRVLMDSQA